MPDKSVAEAIAAEDTFADLQDYAWATESINYLYRRGIVAGHGDGMFAPANDVKREEFVKMLVLSFDILDERAESTFDDCYATDWSYPYIASAQAQGLVTGYSNFFNRTQEITRQDAAVMAYRFLSGMDFEIEGAELSFGDTEEIADYAVEAVSVLVACGIINGMDNGNFAPTEFCTRAQSAKIIFELSKLVESRRLSDAQNT